MRPSQIYVNHRWYTPHVHGPAVEPERTQSWKILDRHYADLPPGAQRAFDGLNAEERREAESLRLWATAFEQAWTNNDPLPPRRAFGKTHGAATSRAKGTVDLTSMDSAYLSVLRSGMQGVTSLEARVKGERGGGISGALSKLHRAGIIVRLEASR